MERAAPPTPAHAALDRGFRLFYRVAYRLLLAWWFLRRPAHQGAVVALWHQGRVLVVRQSYHRHLNLPGGGVACGETPRATAARELAEEIGLTLEAAALTPAFDWSGWWDYRHDHVHVFEHELSAKPPLRLDRREIVAAGFMTPQEALAAELHPFLRAYLLQALAASRATGAMP